MKGGDRMEENQFFTEPEEITVPEETHEEKPKKDSIIKKRNLFRVLSILVFLVSVVCGVFFGFDSYEKFTLLDHGVKTVKTFEIWRFALFGIVGISNGLCLWAVSEVFGILAKKKKKQ